MHVKEKIKTILRALIAFLWRTHTKQRVDSVQEIHPKRTNKKMKERITKLLEALNEGLYERENELKLALLSSIAGESIFFLGPPGVAKSMVARRLKYAYKDANVFEYLMSRFSTPDEIFGPVSISELKNNKYVRVIDGYLPDAEVVFLDEIWKAGPSIQNALLTILNEKIFRNGKMEKPVPMKVLISASNELPDEEAKMQGQSLEAMWDRFLVRLEVKHINDWDNLKEMIKIPSLSSKDEDIKLRNIVTEPINDKEYKEWSKRIDEKEVPKNVLNVIRVIRDKIELYNNSDNNKENTEKQILISDRRWRKIVRLMRTSAFLNDRTEVDLMDCFLIKYCIWNRIEQKDTVWQFVEDAIEENGYTVSLNLGEIRLDIDNFKKKIDEDTKYYRNTPIKELESVYNNYYEILNPPDLSNNLITKTDFDNLNNQNRNMYLHFYRTNWNQVQQNSRWNIRKGNSEISLFINDKEYQLKNITRTERTQITRGPNEYTEKAWDELVNDFLLTISDITSQLKEYTEKDSVHLRTNLFVEPALANIIESHISSTQKEIEKIKLSVLEMQNGYKKLKNNDIVTQ